MRDDDVAPVFVVGCGQVGSTLAIALRERAVPVSGAHSRTARGARAASRATGLEVTHGPLPPSLSGARLVVLAVPDPEIRPVAERLAASGLLGGGEVVVHCSGSRSASELEALAGRVAGTASFHPLLSFADAAVAAEHLSGAAFGIEGDEVAVAAARSLARLLGGEPLVIQAADRPLYHAAAAVASNHLVALTAHAARCLGALGLERDAAVRALVPLVASTVGNLRRRGLPAALTGPVSRGDAGTVSQHLETLAARAPSELGLYLALAREALALAREQGVAAADRLDAVERVLSEPPATAEGGPKAP